MSDPLSPLALSLVVITRDAGTQLADCLASAAFAAEAIVVDSGSRDDTVDIARRSGARVVAQPWLGFGLQKNFAVAQAAHDWVLCLDADERVSSELAGSIRSAMQEGCIELIDLDAVVLRGQPEAVGDELSCGAGL